MFPIPLLFKEGWLRLNKKIPFHSGADGVVRNFKQNTERYASIYRQERFALGSYRGCPSQVRRGLLNQYFLILFEITNHPVCAVKERDLFIEAQPTLLEKEGNGGSTLLDKDFSASYRI